MEPQQPTPSTQPNPTATLYSLLRWIVLGSIVGVMCGLSSALFLYLLDVATSTRIQNEWLVYLLPVAGIVIGLVLQQWGQSILGGNNLVLDTMHVDTSAHLPWRMAPLVLFGSVATHLFGGSAGREGTAVQMGGALADRLALWLKATKLSRLQILSAGVAGGFGAVFGTPFAGAVFGIEVLRVGRMEYHAIVPALVAAVVGDMTTRGVGIQHTAYPVVARLDLTLPVLGQLLVLSMAVAVVSVLFIEATHRLKTLSKQRIPSLPLRMALGGAIVVGLWKLCGTSDYLGLGVPTIVRAFSEPLADGAFAWKLLFTSITLGCGFLGGEVTPLFFIGAALGNLMSRVLHLPLDMAAACGFAAVFGACANTPLACAIMAVELFGGGVLPHIAIVCVFSYLLTGQRSIYPSQRISVAKHSGETNAA